MINTFRKSQFFSTYTFLLNLLSEGDLNPKSKADLSAFFHSTSIENLSAIADIQAVSIKFDNDSMSQIDNTYFLNTKGTWNYYLSYYHLQIIAPTNYFNLWRMRIKL